MEGWIERPRATGRKGSHHVNFELALSDGRVLYTRISHPPNRTTYGPAIWSHILRDQLKVTNDEFWACVVDGVLPARSRRVETEAEAIPVAVVRTLLVDARLPETQVLAMTKEEAIARLAQYYTTGR